ncbi:MAG: FAD-dependent oxidoreductase [Christensenellales bacterium]
MKQISLWEETSSPPKYKRLSGTHRCDIAVAGGGLSGITAALLLRRAGLNVCVAEAGAIGSGTSGRTTAKVTVQHGLKLKGLSQETARAYMAANNAGLVLIEKLIRDLNIDCHFERLPAYVYALTEKERRDIIKEKKVYDKLGVNASIEKSVPLPFDIICALKTENQAQFHPLKYLYSLADELTKEGVPIFEQTRVNKVERNDYGVTLHTRDGRIHADAAVLAAGYPLVEFPGLFFIRMHQSRSYIIAAKGYKEGMRGIFINAGEPVNSVRSYNTDADNWLLAVGYGHKTGSEYEANTGIEPLEGFLRRYFPKTRAYCGWSAQDCITVDGMPYAGALYKDNPNVYVATGYAKWGMTNSAAAAMIICDEHTGNNMIDKEVRAHFSPLRVAPAASAKGFVKQTADTLRTFAAGNINIKAGAYDDVPAGEGAVRRVDGHAAAIGREKDGTLHVFNAHCTHMRCPVEYNEESRSFDCRCHGSRFGLNGEVLSGPAKRPLEPMED